MKPSYGEQIYAEIQKSRKQKDASRLFYYQQAVNHIACASWETFKGSWAYDQWMLRNKDAIQKFVDEQNQRFGYLSHKEWRVV